MEYWAQDSLCGVRNASFQVHNDTLYAKMALFKAKMALFRDNFALLGENLGIFWSKLAVYS